MKNKIYISYLSFFLAFSILLSTIVYFLGIYYNDNIEKFFKNEVKLITELKIENLNNEIQLSTSILNSLKTNTSFLSYINNNSKNNKQYSINLFLSLLNSNKNIYQLRYLDSSGNEKIRIDLNDTSNTGRIIPDIDLQNKSDRYYFINTKNLKEHQIFLSNLDLNIEHGKIEKPIRPMLRISTPIYSNNIFQGIIIINLGMKHILENFINSNIFNFSIFDDNGYILYNTEKKHIFSKYLEKDKFTIQSLYNKNINELISNKYKNIYSKELYYTKYIKNENLYIIAEPNKIFKNNILNEQKQYSIYFSIILFVLSFPLAFIISIYPAKMELKLQNLSITDNLTKTFNRLKIDSILEKELYNAKRYETNFSIIIADIDKFKNINDSYGHQIGDSVLKEFSHLLSTNIRQTDYLGRWGGEEFIIICPNTTIDYTYELAEKLRKIIEKFNFKTVKKVTASFGVSSYSMGDDIHSLIYKSDMALYESKENGRNRVTKKN
ncbi:diguanylate cyclase [Arcobacter sp.]|uniref:sensor domain-containing diguanylate cyclase n=1 Tax=Arcobacter sp. TaxID=1872629 RepID=UPI003D139B18